MRGEEGGAPATTNGGSGAVSSGASGGGAGGGGSAGMPAIVKARDEFTTSAAGWQIRRDGGDLVATHFPTGGFPGGMISGVDDADHTWYFLAPAKYLGDASKLYGGVLSFDIKITPVTMPFTVTDVRMDTDGFWLAFNSPFDPGTSWTHYDVPLTEEHWTLNGINGPVASKAQFQQLLANITSLQIRGEFNTGEDTGMLDNVYFGQ